MLVSFKALEVVHKELIENIKRKVLLDKHLTTFLMVLWITCDFCGYLFADIFESYRHFF